jgi:hypothetical protein
MMCVARMSHMAKCNALKEVTPYIVIVTFPNGDMKRTIGRNKKDWREVNLDKGGCLCSNTTSAYIEAETPGKHFQMGTLKWHISK